MFSAHEVEIESVVANLYQLQTAIALAARESGREASSVKLLAVTKTYTTNLILPLLIAGHRIFGENRVQEAQAKWPLLQHNYPDLQLHLIGPLQTNKVRTAVTLFDVIETVDKPKLAITIAQEMQLQARRPDCLIQINTGEEPQKAGILPAEADAFINACIIEWKLPIKGLMCIPPVGEEPTYHFALLRDIARRHNLPTLSMGMSHDFHLAICLGATQVRIGTALFSFSKFS